MLFFTSPPCCFSFPNLFRWWVKWPVPNHSARSITFLFSIFETLKRQVLYIKFKAPEFKTNKQHTTKKKGTSERHSLCRTVRRLTPELRIMLRSSQPWQVSTTGPWKLEKSQHSRKPSGLFCIRLCKFFTKLRTCDQSYLLIDFHWC